MCYTKDQVKVALLMCMIIHWVEFSSRFLFYFTLFFVVILLLFYLLFESFI